MLSMNSFAMPALALGFAVSAGVGGCMLDRRPLRPSDGGMGGDGGMTVTDGGGGMGGDGGIGGDGGMGGEGGMGGGSLITGSQYIPTAIRPMEAAMLTPARALFVWQNGDTPLERSLEGYEFCRTAGPVTEIDEVSECPNSQTIAGLFQALTPLVPNTTYRWKIRARYDGGYYSEWSAVRVFSTDDSLVGWWEMNGNASDTSPSMNHGTLQNGTSFGSGFVMQGLNLDGMNDHVTVSDQPAFDFGGGDFTLSVWVFTQETGANQVFIEKRDGANGYLLTRRASGALRFHGDVCGVVEGGMLTHGDWHHVAVRRNSSAVRIYIDGTEVGAGSCTENFSNPAVLTFGCNTPTNTCTEPLNGIMDDVMLLGGTTIESIENEFCAGHALAGTDPLPPSCLGP